MKIIMKAIAYMVAFVFLLSACALDSDSWIPLMVCCICGVWLVVFGWINGIFGGQKNGRK